MTHWRQSTKRSVASAAVIDARMESFVTSRPLISRILDAWEIAIGAPAELIVRHFEKRIFELAMAVAQFGEGILLLFSPNSIQASSFHLMLNYFSDAASAALFLFVGILRIVALFLNGRWMPNGAYVRIAGCIVGAFLWLQMAFALGIYNELDGLPLSPGIPIYVTLTIFEVVSIARAVHGLKRWRLYGQSD